MLIPTYRPQGGRVVSLSNTLGDGCSRHYHEARRIHGGLSATIRRGQKDTAVESYWTILK